MKKIVTTILAVGIALTTFAPTTFALADEETQNQVFETPQRHKRYAYEQAKKLELQKRHREYLAKKMLRRRAGEKKTKDLIERRRRHYLSTQNQ